MSYAFRCDKTGLPEIVDCPGTHPCPFCSGKHEAYETGIEKSEGMPSIHDDKLRPHFDHAAGCEISSKSQRRRIYKEKGLRLKSYTEHYRHNPKPGPKPGTVISYPGMTSRKSSAERHYVRTKTGQGVV